MIYEVSVRLDYAYDPPVAAGRNLLRLWPLSLPGLQRVIAADIAANPAPAERADRTDFFGNVVTEMVHRRASDRTGFVLRARVERLAPSASAAPSPALEDIGRALAAVNSLAPESPHHFTAPSPRVPADGAIAAYAARAAAGADSVRGAVEALGRAIHRDMVFDALATTVDTPAAHAFALGRGVCQDFSHIMLTGLRALGVPGAYVSGLLRTEPPPGKERLEGADAMHAWVRAWCGARAGWVEYDPTNACTAGEGHIAVAIGRDYDDVAPVQGSLRAAGLSRSAQSVDVIEIG